jgi:copper homeostasis protein
MKKKLEVIATDVAHVIEANRLGVDRIELCSALSADGLSPSYGMVKWAVQNADMPVMVMVRPREGDFVYTDQELDVMLDEVRWAKSCGAMGIVVGVLNQENEVNILAMRRLVQLAYPMEVTFHRAMDVVMDPLKSLEEIIDLGCTRILTSGQQSSCIEGKDLILEMQRQAGDRIVIMAGAGINAECIEEMKCNEIMEYHMSGLTRLDRCNRQEMVFGSTMVSRSTDISLVLEKLRT